jgi:hypothetical protein
VQSRIDSFFTPVPFDGTSIQMKRNLRLKKALDLLKQKTYEATVNSHTVDHSNDDDDDDEQQTSIGVSNSVVIKARKKRQTSQLINRVLSASERTRSSLRQGSKRKSSKSSSP